MDTSQLLKGVLPMAALSVISTGDAYGYEVLHELRSAGLGTVGDASVYGTLRRLFQAGALSSYVVPSEEGPHRKYYGLNDHGRSVMALSAKTWVGFAQTMDHLLSKGAAA